jgi:type II secretory pathway component PulF
MAVFAYKAIEAATGKRKTGELAADSAYQVRLSLRRMGLQAQTVKAVKARSGDREGGSLEAIQQRFQRSRRRQPLIEFYENLMTLISSGSAVVPSLETLAVSARKARSTAAMGTMCRQLAEQVRGGANLADAMSKQTDWFSLIDVALVRSGQQSGHLEQSLGDLATLHGQSDTLRHRLVGVMTYPVILMTVGIAVVIFLSAVPIPQLAGALQDSGHTLPFPTKVVLGIGIAFRFYWWALIFLIPAALAVSYVVFRSRAAALFRLRLPILGTLIAKVQLSSFCGILERLLLGGISLTEAVQLATPTISNSALREVFKAVPRQLADGKNLADPLRQSGLFDPVFVRVMEIGVESGELPLMIGTVGRRYAEISKRLIDRFATVMEPLIIVALASMLGFVVFAAILPMLRLTQTL